MANIIKRIFRFTTVHCIRNDKFCKSTFHANTAYGKFDLRRNFRRKPIVIAGGKNENWTWCSNMGNCKIAWVYRDRYGNCVQWINEISLVGYLVARLPNELSGSSATNHSLSATTQPAASRIFLSVIYNWFDASLPFVSDIPIIRLFYIAVFDSSYLRFFSRRTTFQPIFLENIFHVISQDESYYDLHGALGETDGRYQNDKENRKYTFCTIRYSSISSRGK